MRRFEYVNRVLSTGYETKHPDFKLPERATKNSCGYDFYNPETVSIDPYDIVYVKTGVKAYFQPDEMLILANRSSNPKKKGLVVINGIGVVECDYADNEDNEGELAFAFMNITNKTVTIEKGEKLGQAIFVKFLTADDDNANGERRGGFGSTGK